MKLKLKNYSTTIKAEKSIFEIEEILRKFGATNFSKKANPKTQQYIEVMFAIEKDGQRLPFKLPVDINGVAQYILQIENERRTRTYLELEDCMEQAYKITWRIIKDWIHAQVSIIESGLVPLEVVMLPYLMIDKDKTLAQSLMEGNLQNLLEAHNE